MNEAEILIIGANGQLGRALQAQYAGAQAADVDKLDITDAESVKNYGWSKVKIILNAAAYTNVDGAESAEGRIAAWKVNVAAVGNLTKAALEHDLTLVHISTDYVFDGTKDNHTETEDLAPLGVYAQTKAAADVVVSLAPKHYILRSSWVIGDGKNFVRSIMGLAAKDISPKVVADQFGRLTFTTELARGIDHLLTTNAEYGTYNLSNGGNVVSWADIAREVYKDLGRDDLTVGDTTAEEYFAGKVSSPRPTHSALDLSKISKTGFEPRNWRDDLKDYIQKETKS